MLKIPKKPVIVKNGDFQTIIVRVLFPFQEEEKDLARLAILPNLLMFMNNKYKTEEEFQKNRKKNYILSSGCSRVTVGTTSCLVFNMIIPDIEALGFDHLDKQFEFFSEMIYNPKIQNGGFDEFDVNREKENLQMSISNGLKNLKVYQAVRGLEKIDDEGILSRSVENHYDQIAEATPKNVYRLYLNIINEYQPAIFIFGNVDEDKINKLCEKYLYKTVPKKLEIEQCYNKFLKVRRDKEQVINDKGAFKDSSISFYYKVKDMSEDDFNYLSLIKSLLNSLSSRMLNKVLRDQNDLVYAASAITYQRFGVLEITAYINKDNKEIVKEKILDVINSLKNPNNIREYLENIKERKRIALIKMLDDKYALLNDQMYQTLEIDKGRDYKYQEILKISAEDISQFVERLALDTIFFVEEEQHD